METDKKTKMIISTLWIVVMVNVAMADIFGFMLTLMSGESQAFQPGQLTMLIFAIIMEIPIVMIILSRILKEKANRIANIIASIITILFVIVGGSWMDLHYIFFASVEILCMIVIILIARKWPKEEGIRK